MVAAFTCYEDTTHFAIVVTKKKLRGFSPDARHWVLRINVVRDYKAKRGPENCTARYAQFK